MNRCLCGATVYDPMAEANTELHPEDWIWAVWKHVPGSYTRCTEVRRIEDVPLDRDLAQATTKQMVDLVAYAKMCRRAAITEVWNVLVNAGDLAGARLVRDMIEEVK